MQKFFLTFAALIVLAVILFGTAQAGNVYDRTVVSSTASNGVVYWTNLTDYAAIKLNRLGVERATSATNMVSFYRITADGLYTQAIGAVTCASGAGVQATLTTTYLKPGDKIRGNGWDSTVAVSNTYRAMFEYEVQKH